MCKWGIKYVHSVTTDHVVSTCAPPLPTYQVLRKSIIVFSLEKERFTFDVDDKLYICTYIHTDICADSVTTEI